MKPERTRQASLYPFARLAMVQRWVLVLACTLSVFSGPVSADASNGVTDPGEPMAASGRIVVAVRRGAEASIRRSLMQGTEFAFLAADDACSDTTNTDTTVQVWRTPEGGEDSAIALLQRNPLVAFAVRDYRIVHAAETAPETPYAPNDPFYFDRQWGLQRAGVARALQQAATLKTTGVRVAVVDSGVDIYHPDLAGALLPGKNYVTPGATPLDDFGHGTHVAGIIGAGIDNGLGIAGIAPGVQIDPRKVLDHDGSGYITDLRIAICEAARDGARIINLSVEINPRYMEPPYEENYALLKGAIDYAAARGVLLVAAGSNSFHNGVWYPARFDEVMAVAATTIDGQLPQQPAYGPQGPELDIAAPGGDAANPILSLWPSSASVQGNCSGNGRYLLVDQGAYYCGEFGTSMASPHVAGVAALLMALQPTLTAHDTRSILESTALRNGLPVESVGAGILDAAAAVRAVLPKQLIASPYVWGATVQAGAAPFTRTFVLANPSLQPLHLSGKVVSDGIWAHASTVDRAPFDVKIEHGHPAFLSLVISPTHLITGTYTGSVDLTTDDPDAQNAVEHLKFFVNVNEFANHRYLPEIYQDGMAGQSPANTPFLWENTGEKSRVTFDADGRATVALPFLFPFGGPQSPSPLYDKVTVDADGFLLFSATPAALPDLAENGCLPQVSPDLQGIFGWWADLEQDAAGANVVTFQPETDVFVVEFDDVPAVKSALPGYQVSFQMVLYADGAVQLNYLDTPPLTGILLGRAWPQVTTGIQARGGRFVNQIGCIAGGETSLMYGALPSPHQSIRILPGELY